MLVEHRIDDVNEGFIAGKQAVSPGQQVTLQPALAGMFTQDFHYPSIRCQVLILGQRFGKPGFGCDVIQASQPVGSCFIGRILGNYRFSDSGT